MVFEESRWVLSLSIMILVMMLLIDKGGTDNALEVKTPYGTFRGHIIKSRGGRDLIAFKGVPYAKPPVGTLRFQEAVKLDPSDKIFYANKVVECLQPKMKIIETINFLDTIIVGREDCLYLNIYRPKEISLKKLPVYFWIHGGSFNSGSGTEEWFGPRYFLDGKRDLILVTINYRLNVFGFLGASDVNLPENLGLKDQTMALKWVKENIELFGGDPELITIGGHSAGAASVSYHLHSKTSKGLFHRAVSHSGTVFSPWARRSSKQAREIIENISSEFGCQFESKNLLKCLQAINSREMLFSRSLISKEGNIELYLTPVIEDDSPTAFITRESFETGSDVPWLSGVTNEEGLSFYYQFGLYNTKSFDLSYLNETYKSYLPVLLDYGPREDEDEITEELVNFYFGGKNFGPEYATKFVQLVSDISHNYDLQLAARKYKGKLFMYKFSYRGNYTTALIRPKGLENGVAHGDDMLYFFNSDIGIKTDLEGRDLNYSNMLLDMWYNFMIHGDPTPESNLWKDSEGGEKYLDLTNHGPIMSSNMFQKRVEYFDLLDKKYKLYSEI